MGFSDKVFEVRLECCGLGWKKGRNTKCLEGSRANGSGDKGKECSVCTPEAKSLEVYSCNELIFYFF